MIKKIVTLTSGGDAPGMNAALRAVVRSALHAGIEVYGSENGFSGLVQQKLIPLNARSVANCIQRGGTLLKTKRVPEFYQAATRQHASDFLRSQQIDGLITTEPELDIEISKKGSALVIRGDFTPGETYSIMVSSGIRSSLGQSLARNVQRSVVFSHLKT